MPAGDRLATAAGADATVVAATRVATPRLTYNLTVEAAHTFFVGQAGLSVHNACDVGGRGANTPPTSFGAKIEKQMAKSGWTKDTVEQTIVNPHRTVQTRDTRHLPGSGRMDDTATAYINKDGSYVVRNDRTGDIVQVSDRTDPNWKSPFPE